MGLKSQLGVARFAMAVVVLLAAALMGANAHAAYPDHPVRIIVPWAAGGNVDTIARLVAKELSAELHQSFIVENVAGASGNIGEWRVAHSPADGYTLLFNSVTHVIVPSVIAHVPVDPFKDFAPVGQTDTVPFLLVANAHEPFSTLPEFLTWAKAQKTAVPYSSSGVGASDDLAGALFAQQAHVNLKNIPYKGSAPALVDVYSGLIPIKFDAPTGLAGGLTSGQIKPIALAATQRLPQYPNVPTFAELGYPKMLVSTWHGLYAPAGTPKAVVERLNAALNRLDRHPDEANILRGMSAEIVQSTPAQFAAYNHSEYDRWKKLIDQVGIAPK